MRKLLTRLQFSHGPGGLMKEPQGKCPVCLGWEGGPDGRGEVPMQHTKDCELAAALREPDEVVTMLKEVIARVEE